MDKNFKQKVKDFFRKEGFYVVLFLCLCAVTVVAAISIKKTKVDDTPNVEANDRGQIAIDNKSNETPEVKAPANSTEVKNNDKTQQASTTPVAPTFIRPVAGKVIVDLKVGADMEKAQQINQNTKTQKVIFGNGLLMECKSNEEVKAAADGVVCKISDSKVTDTEDGYYVEVQHSDGTKIRYSNLSSNIKVKLKDSVKQGQVIGTGGNSASTFTTRGFKDFVLIKAYDKQGKEVSPKNYIKL